MTCGWRKASIRAGAVALNGAGKETPQEDSRAQVHHCNILSLVGFFWEVGVSELIVMSVSLRRKMITSCSWRTLGGRGNFVFVAVITVLKDVHLRCGETFDCHHLRLFREPSVFQNA